MKKIILALILSTGMLGVATKCCSDVVDYHYWNMNDFDIQYINSEWQVFQADSTSSDTLSLQCAVSPTFIAQQFDISSLFVNTAVALSCKAAHGDMGLKNKLINFSITSSEDFDSYTAGSELKGLCFFDTNLNYGEWLAQINESSIHYRYFVSFPSKPTQSISRNFKIVFTFADGTTKEQTSHDIVWH
jgi:hypothetical protein